MKGEEEVTTIHEEEVLESLDCSGCGGTLVGYAADGEKIYETPYCTHANLCRDCEAETSFDDALEAKGCPDCLDDWMDGAR